ncbi:MAG: Fic family protein [Rhodospirillales bacterium]|nr:Fic family protein [Rhodospirillales bacterium]MCB9996071.1 Fic family protein [Rhodospirillales bacterium]
MKKGQGLFFDTNAIYASYQNVQAEFDTINKTINCGRDAFDDDVKTHLMLAYNFLNARLGTGEKRTLLTPSDLLELNAIVHLGTDAELRQQYKGFLKQTEDKFYKHLPYLLEWCKRHERSNDDPYKIAAGLYVRILAEPQLFFDGNHRTGALVANYYLLKNGLNPFVLTTGNAVEFFNLASDVKFKKRDIQSKFKRAVGWRDEVHAMRDFLKKNALPFTASAPEIWQGEPQKKKSHDAKSKPTLGV